MQDSSLIFFYESNVLLQIVWRSRASIEGSEAGNFLRAKSREKVIEAANKLCDLSLATNVHISDQK